MCGTTQPRWARTPWRCGGCSTRLGRPWGLVTLFALAAVWAFLGLVILALVFAALWWVVPFSRLGRIPADRCRQCGYDVKALRETGSTRCPECGHALPAVDGDMAALARATQTDAALQP